MGLKDALRDLALRASDRLTYGYEDWNLVRKLLIPPPLPAPVYTPEQLERFQALAEDRAMALLQTALAYQFVDLHTQPLLRQQIGGRVRRLQASLVRIPGVEHDLVTAVLEQAQVSSALLSRAAVGMLQDTLGTEAIVSNLAKGADPKRLVLASYQAVVQSTSSEPDDQP